jgi:hypothetical protein
MGITREFLLWSAPRQKAGVDSGIFLVSMTCLGEDKSSFNSLPWGGKGADKEKAGECHRETLLSEA